MVLGTNQGVSTQITQIFRQKSCVASEIRHKAFLRVKITIRHKLQVLTWIKTLRKTCENVLYAAPPSFTQSNAIQHTELYVVSQIILNDWIKIFHGYAYDVLF